MGRLGLGVDEVVRSGEDCFRESADVRWLGR